MLLTMPVLFVGTAHPAGAAASKPAAESLLNCVQAQHLLTLRRNLLEKKIAAEEARARGCAQRGNEKGALAALRQKKLLASNLEQVETSLLRLGEQQSALEGVAATAETVAALAAGGAASRATMAQLGPEQVDAIYDNMAEAAEEARQVQDALAVPLGAAAELDDAELEAELQELEAAQLEEVGLEAAAAAAAAAPAAQEAKPIQAAAAVPALPATPAARPQPAARLAQRQEAGSEGDEEVKAPRAEVAA
ncbi:hypothetical protein COHA_009295 [Chlorella ohadii]|uniref:Uncharacterized protein n=1 Tax=Chlorella ohadii TaxID=2649997 RepID=A0AAD5H2D5_9CHLO|nr:hypothetical protein COHA_009295 [Chlorella ohadii]